MPRHGTVRSRSSTSPVRRLLHSMRSGIAGAARLFTPGARGVYPPHSNSLIVLGVALPNDIDVGALERRLWWRGLGLVERDRHLIVGADITAAVQRGRVRQARQFVIKQLRGVGVRGAVTRWEHPSLKRSARGEGRGKRGDTETRDTRHETRGSRDTGTGNKGKQSRQQANNKQASRTNRRSSNSRSNIQHRK